MAKVKLVLHPDEHTSFKAFYLRPIFEQYFEYIDYDETTNYSGPALFAIHVLTRHNPWVERVDYTGKVIVDNLWESKLETVYKSLVNKNWFWYNEALWYKALGYDSYLPDKNYSKLAFMPINLVKPHRTALVNKLVDVLHDFVYSYNSKLPGDSDKSNPDWQRYMNPSWYDDTYFSVVVETAIHGTGFTTEKTFKPLAYYHPFLCYGQTGTISFIKQLGFESFDNLFDESYDTVVDPIDRLDKIIANVRNFKKEPYDKYTLDKLRHNHNLFFDTELVTKRIVEEIIYPMLEIANAK